MKNEAQTSEEITAAVKAGVAAAITDSLQAIPKTDTDTMNRINAAINAAITEGLARVWGGVRPPQPPVPIHDGDGTKQTGEPFGDEYRGCYVITASDELPPKIVDANLNPLIDQTQIYSGCYGRVGIRFFAYNNASKKGIGCGLDAIQKLEDGQPLGGRGPVDPAAIFGTPAPAAFAPSVTPAQPQYYAAQPQYYAAQQQPVAYPTTTPAYAPVPAYAPPAVPQPGYGATPAPAQAYSASPGAYSPAAPTQQINPITGQPMATGGILGM